VAKIKMYPLFILIFPQARTMPFMEMAQIVLLSYQHRLKLAAKVT
jgi:hypothetical protein